MNHAFVQVFHGPGRPFELRSVPLPTDLSPGEVLVEITLATICGSDLHTFQGRRPAPTPCVLGHEAVGRVVASARLGVLPGERVTWSLVDSCGFCPACAEHSLPQKCVSLSKYGHAAFRPGAELNGCYASHILLRSGTAVFPVPAEVPDALAAPANCALATVQCILAQRPARLKAALVQGGGLLGVYACAALSELGVGRVYCCDVSDQRLALVREFGGQPLRTDGSSWDAARELILADTGGGVDFAIEVAGAPAVVPQGLALLRPGGHYAWAGMVHPDSQLDFTGEEVVRKCLTIRGVHNYAPPELDAALRFLAATAGRFPYAKLVSPPRALSHLDEAFAAAQERTWLRVSVRPSLS